MSKQVGNEAYTLHRKYYIMQELRNLLGIPTMLDQTFDKTKEGKRVENIPRIGTMTGCYEVRHEGCWWQIFDDAGQIFWMIGEYPNIEEG